MIINLVIIQKYFFILFPQDTIPRFRWITPYISVCDYNTYSAVHTRIRCTLVCATVSTLKPVLHRIMLGGCITWETGSSLPADRDYSTECTYATDPPRISVFCLSRNSTSYTKRRFNIASV